MQEYPPYAEVLTHYLAILTIVGAIVILGYALYMAYMVYTKKESRVLGVIASYVYPITFFTTFGGLFLTLFYSEVLRYAPCDLCWYQRVFLYPQVFMFAYAWYKKDTHVLPYSLILSAVGFGIALYHHALQMGYDIMKPCSTAPFAVDCSTPSFIEFGFVTFPFMAVVLFGFLGLIATTAMVFSKKK